MMRKIILVELNEVPFRVIDQYVAERPHSWTARLLANAVQYETYTEDAIQLDPWISWPSMHRGVNDRVHGILHLGQPLDEVDRAYPPIWSLLIRHGRRVGVFGSLHSNNVPSDVEDYEFYFPDYFSDEAYAKPAALLPFQKLNIVMTRASARNVSRGIPAGLAAAAVKSLPALGIKFGTLLRGFRQLAAERVDARRRTRRRDYQTLLMADAFVAQLESEKPDFSTFYLNNVAAAMHRYWAALFPGDYEPLRVPPQWLQTYREEILVAMDTFDHILRKLVAFADRHPEFGIAVATSMGQAAISCEPVEHFLTIVDLDRFMAALGLEPSEWRSRPAMAPCIGVVVADAARSRLRRQLAGLEIDGQPIARDDRPIAPMTWDERECGFFHFYLQFDDYRGPGQVRIGNRSLTAAEAGLGWIAHEDGVNCTAQHVSDGFLLVYPPETGGRPDARRRRISTLDFAPSVLGHFGIDKPAYMSGSASIRF